MFCDGRYMCAMSLFVRCPHERDDNNYNNYRASSLLQSLLVSALLMSCVLHAGARLLCDLTARPAASSVVARPPGTLQPMK